MFAWISKLESHGIPIIIGIIDLVAVAGLGFEALRRRRLTAPVEDKIETAEVAQEESEFIEEAGESPVEEPELNQSEDKLFKPFQDELNSESDIVSDKKENDE